jgi:hypothetical protein
LSPIASRSAARSVQRLARGFKHGQAHRAHA